MVSYTQETTNLTKLGQNLIKSNISQKDPVSVAATVILDEKGKIAVEEALVLENYPLSPGRSAYVQVIKEGGLDYNAEIHRYDLCYGNYNFINQPGVCFADNLLTALVSGAEGWGAGSHPGNSIAIRTYPEDKIILFDSNHDEVIRRTLPLDLNAMTFYIAGRDYDKRKEHEEKLSSDLIKELNRRNCRVTEGHRFSAQSGRIFANIRSYSDGGTCVSMPNDVAFPPDLIHWVSDYIKRNKILCRGVLSRDTRLY